MDGPIALEIIEDGGIFRHGEAYDEIVDELDATLDQREGGRLAGSKYLAALKAIVERHPHFVDGHAHLGYALMEQRKPKLALESCLRGLALGERAIPNGFAGLIEWGFLENRPFLRAAHGAVLCHLQLGQPREALALMERILAWNPNDNQGVRFLIGSEYLRIGETEKALHVFNGEADDYPPYHYERALLHFIRDETVAAATSLRRGFAANGYIAEMLCGMSAPMPLAVWHSSNLAEPETAIDYLELHGDLWRKTKGAVAFIRWLHMHPKVLTERAAILECKEALLWKRDLEERRVLVDREAAIVADIDDRLSNEIVKERTDLHGKPVFPWLYPQMQSRFGR